VIEPEELRSLDTPAMRKKITPIIIESTDHFKEVIRHGDDFATTVLDHASGYQDICVREVAGLKSVPVQRAIPFKRGEQPMVSKAQWGKISLMCKEGLLSVLNLRSNVFIVAQERDFSKGGDEDAAVVGSDTDLVIPPVVGAALIPSVTSWLNPSCSYVVQTFLRPKVEDKVTIVNNQKIVTKVRGRGVEYCIRTEPHEVYMTKFRVPKGTPLPPVVTDPSYEKIMKIIRGK
jgi:hypothetical protein